MLKRDIVYTLLFLLVGVGLARYSFIASFVFFVVWLFLELVSYALVETLRKDFQWLITHKDRIPELDKEGLKKFWEHGFDSELGWIRKPNSSKDEVGRWGKTRYHIDKFGHRKNPKHEKLAKKISCYGDSFTFARQVNDDETWEWQLSELTKSNVLNLGVGNYGVDQALLRLKRDYKKNKTRIVIMGVVPSTIVRILSVWKHYNEFGNTFGFKPRFVLDKGELKLVKNIIDSEKKFLRYSKYIDKLRKWDYFYKNKFEKEIITFPYFITLFRNPGRNFSLLLLVSWYKLFGKKETQGGYPLPMKVIMDVNLRLRYKLFKGNKQAVRLFERILEEFVNYSRKMKFKPVFLFMPQKDDILLIRKKGKFYDDFVKSVGNKMVTIDLTDHFINSRDLDRLYSDDNKYGGHYSKFGNKVVAKIISDRLKKEEIL